MIVLFGTVVHNLLEIPSISVCGLQSGDEIVFGWWGGGGGSKLGEHQTDGWNPVPEDYENYHLLTRANTKP